MGKKKKKNITSEVTAGYEERTCVRTLRSISSTTTRSQFPQQQQVIVLNNNKSVSSTTSQFPQQQQQQQQQNWEGGELDFDLTQTNFDRLASAQSLSASPAGDVGLELSAVVVGAQRGVMVTYTLGAPLSGTFLQGRMS